MLWWRLAVPNYYSHSCSQQLACSMNGTVLRALGEKKCAAGAGGGVGAAAEADFDVGGY